MAGRHQCWQVRRLLTSARVIVRASSCIIVSIHLSRYENGGKQHRVTVPGLLFGLES